MYLISDFELKMYTSLSKGWHHSRLGKATILKCFEKLFHSVVFCSVFCFLFAFKHSWIIHIFTVQLWLFAVISAILWFVLPMDQRYCSSSWSRYTVCTTAVYYETSMLLAECNRQNGPLYLDYTWTFCNPPFSAQHAAGTWNMLAFPLWACSVHSAALEVNSGLSQPALLSSHVFFGIY